MRTFAIDFETANAKRASACALGVVELLGLELAFPQDYLIRPKDMVFQGINIGVHGIHPEDVAEEPEFPEIWRQAMPSSEPMTLLAHNAAFDMSVLRDSLALYGMKAPAVSYLCTVAVAQKVWPHLRDHKLPTVSEFLAITLDHHQAGSDAVACGKIAIAAMQATATTTPRQLATKFGLPFKSLV